MYLFNVHSFPKNEKTRQLWISAIGQENFKPTNTNGLCSQHFEKKCFFYPLGGEKKRRHIKPDAVPTIFGFYYPPKRTSNIKKIQIVKVISDTVNNTIAEQNTIKNGILNEKPSSSNTNDTLDNNQSDMKIIDDDPNTDSCNKRPDSKNNHEMCYSSYYNKYLVKNSPKSEVHDMIPERDTNNVTLTSTLQQPCHSQHHHLSSHEFRAQDCSEKILKFPLLATHNWQIATKTINYQRRKTNIAEAGSTT